MSKSRKRVRNSESSESTSNEGPSGDEIPELDTLLRPKKRRKVNQTAANKKPDTSGGKKHVKEFFGIDPSKIRQRIPQAEFEDYESIDDEPRKRTAVRYASSDEDEMEYEEEQENVPTPSKDEPVVLSSEMLQSRLEMAKYIIDGDGTDIGLYNIFVSPRDVEEVIKTAFLDDAEYQLTPTGLIDYATVKGKQIVLQTSGAVSVGEGSLSGNEPNFNLSDPMQYLSAKQAANLRLFLRAHKLIFMLNYYKYEVDHVKQLFERWQRARFACQQAYEFARSQVMWIRCKWETFDPNRYMNAVDFYMERMSFHIGETRETINKMKKRGGAAQIAEYISIHLQMEDLRRNPSGTVLYQQLMQQNGKPTFTWHPYKTLSQYVIDKCYPDSQLYSSLTENPGTLSAVTGILAPDGIKGANSPEHPCLPIVRMNRYLFAYRNGVYDTKANKFYDNPARCPHQNLTACRFFDAEFNNKWLDPTFNWRDIETPNIESIMKHQEFDVQGKRAEEEALRRAGKTPSKDNEKAKKNDQQTKEDFSKSSTKARMQMSEDQQAMYRQLDDWHADPHSLIDWIYGFGGRMLYDQAEIDR